MDDMHPAERFFSAAHPLNSYLQIDFVDATDDIVTVEMEAPDCFDEGSGGGRTHSGLATLILDTVMGSAAMGSLPQIMPIATAGLTTQHMRHAVKGEKLRCTAKLEGIHADMAHMSGKLYSADTQEILSLATGTFMIGTRSKPLGARL